MQSACVMAKADYCLPWNGQPRYVRNSVTFFWLHLCSVAWWISPLGSRTEWFAFAVNEKSRNTGFVQELQVVIRFTLELVLCFFFSAFHPGFLVGLLAFILTCWDYFLLGFFSFFFLLLPDFIRFASGYHDPREANGCFFSLVANPETQLFCRCLYHEILCYLCQQVLIRRCSPFESISNGFVPTYVSAQRSVFASSFFSFLIPQLFLSAFVSLFLIRLFEVHCVYFFLDISEARV